MRLLHPTMRASRGAPDNPWRVLCEAQAVARESVKKTRAELQTADGFTARSHDFPAGNILDAVNETCEVTLANAPAGNHLYEAHYKVTIDPVIPGGGTNTHKVVVAIETDLTGGGSWVEYWTHEYELVTKVGEADRVVEWKSERLTARVPSLTSSSKLRLKVKAASGPGGWTFQVHGFNLATNGDLLSGVTYHTGPAFDFNENGGGAELADTVVTKLSHGSHTTFMTDLGGPPLIRDVAPFIVARSVWGSNDSSDIAIDRFTAHLHPKENAGNPKDVVWFVCQPYALRQANTGGATEHKVQLVPLGYPVRVPAGDGTTAQDYVFSWADRDITGPTGLIVFTLRKPRPKSVRPRLVPESAELEYDTSPTTFWFIWALKADGSAATNVGWAQDAGTTEVVNSTRKLRTVQIRNHQGDWFAEGPKQLGATARGVLRCKIDCGSYTNANLEFTGGNLLDFGASPTETVEFVGSDSVPEGCQGIFEVRNNADTDWLPFKDGQTAAEVGVSQRQTYKVRYRALTNSQSDASPVLFEIGVRDVKRVWLGDITDRVRGRWHIPDVAELIPAIPEMKIRVLRTGDSDDFNDRITKLFAEHYSTALAFRLWVGDPTRPRNEWHHKDDGVLVDDYDPRDSYIDIIAHTPAVYLRSLALPVYNVTTEKREALTLANKTPRQLWAEIVNNQLGADIPNRVRGEGFLDDSTLLTKTITDSDGKTELDAIGQIVGAVVSSDAGKVRAFDMFTPMGIQAVFPADEITWQSSGPGSRQRVPEFFVLYDYRKEIPKYEGEARVINGTALLNLKTRGLDAPKTLRDEVCQWIPTETIARDVGKRRTDTLGGGMLVWSFTSTKPYPELRFGNVVAVETSRFVARDPTQTTLRQIKGQQWVVGRIIDYDIEGREFGIWIQSWADFLGSVEIGQRLGYGFPVLEHLQLNLDLTGTVKVAIGASSATAVRVAVSTSGDPTEATTRAASLVPLDAVGNVTITSSTITSGQTLFVAAFAYEKVDGSGGESAIRRAQITKQQTASEPQVVAVVPTGFAAATTDHNVPMPATVVAGELLLIVFGQSQAGGPAPSTPSGWTQLRTENTPSTNKRLTIYGKVAVGTEGGTTVNVVTSANAEAAALAYRIAQWYGALAGVENAVAEASAQDADPPNLTPSWAADRNLWFAIHLSNAVEGGSTPPADYTTTGNDNQGNDVGGVVEVETAQRLFYAASQNPGIFDRTTGSEYVAVTLAVRPPA